MSETTAVLPDPQSGAGRRRTRGLVAVGASVLAVVLIAVGGFAAWQFFSAGGSRPAEVLPDSTFALVTVDLDPSGGQKIEAVQTLRKFPSLKQHIGATGEDDLLKVIVEAALEGSPCKALDYDKDLKPWIGSRAGIGGVLLEDEKPAPALVLQVRDAERAKSGFTKLTECTEAADEKDFGWTVSDEYVVASDSTSHAEAIAAAGAESPLSADADFQKWTDEAGGSGIMNAYLSRDGAQLFTEEFASKIAGGAGGWGAAEGELAKSLEDFEGAAAGLRFADEGIEVSVAGGGVQGATGDKVGDHVGALPSDTAAVLAFGVPEDAVKQLGNAKGGPFSFGGMLGAGLGLDIPKDLIDLLGSSLSVSLGAEAPADLAAVAGPGDLPVGALIHGDEAKIRKVIEKIEARIGRQLADVPVALSSGQGKVAIATTPDYGDQLLADGSLGETKPFTDVVENADDAQGVIYLSFENDWMGAVQRLLLQEGDAESEEIADNLAVLRALGASAWSEGDNGYAHVRLALK